MKGPCVCVRRRKIGVVMERDRRLRLDSFDPFYVLFFSNIHNSRVKKKFQLSLFPPPPPPPPEVDDDLLTQRFDARRVVYLLFIVVPLPHTNLGMAVKYSDCIRRQSNVVNMQLPNVASCKVEVGAHGHHLLFEIRNDLRKKNTFLNNCF